MRSSKSKAKPTLEEPSPFFPEFDSPNGEPKKSYKRIDHAIWSHNKASFIALYLRFFVQITHHGAYIDGFSGPQYPEQLEAWTAAQVLASRPKWLRQFFLCEINPKKFAYIEKLVASQPIPYDRKWARLPREVSTHQGDFNVIVDKILESPRLTKEKAVFCLIDQHTFECDWKTLVKLSKYRSAPQNKVELLYFLGVGWIHRAMSGLNDPAQMEPWWGRSDWEELPQKSCYELSELVRSRFSEELGYTHTAAYPIFDGEQSNRIMYYMIHASDHPEAPALMARAHGKAVRLLAKKAKQEVFAFDSQ